MHLRSGSGDNGATDWADVAMTHFSSTPIVNFPADVRWVIAVESTGTGLSCYSWMGCSDRLGCASCQPVHS